MQLIWSLLRGLFADLEGYKKEAQRKGRLGEKEEVYLSAIKKCNVMGNECQYLLQRENKYSLSWALDKLSLGY